MVQTASHEAQYAQHAIGRASVPQRTRNDNLPAQMIHLIQHHQDSIMTIESGSITFHFGSPGSKRVRLSFTTELLSEEPRRPRGDNLVPELISLIKQHQAPILVMDSGSITVKFGKPGSFPQPKLSYNTVAIQTT